MRILRINDYTGTPGGAEAYMAAVSGALTARGHPQRILTISDVHDHLDYQPMPGEEVFPLRPMGARRVLEDVVDSPPLRQRLTEVVDEFRPDLIHLHHFDSLYAPMARFLRSCPVPLVMTAHDAKLVCPIATLVLPDGRLCEGGILPRCQLTGCEVGWGLPYKLDQMRIFRRDVAPRIRLFFAPSRAAAGFLDRHGFRPAQVLAPFIDVPGEVERTPPPWSPGPPTVGFLGRLETYKGAATLLRAFAQARQGVPSLRLVIAGRGPQEPALREQARALGPELSSAVKFPGWVEGTAKEAFFAGIHLLTVPSEGYENFGLIGLEAFVRARPVLGSQLGGIPDWLDDPGSGRLLPAGEVDAWARAIVESFASPERLREQGAHARARYLERFRPETHVDALLRAYGQVLSGPAIPPS